METLIYIGALGVFSYLNQMFSQRFKGSSIVIKFLHTILGAVGYLSYFVFLIWSFWKFAWWQPIVTFISSVILSGIIGAFSNNIVGQLLSIIAVPVFFILSIIALL